MAHGVLEQICVKVVSIAQSAPRTQTQPRCGLGVALSCVVLLPLFSSSLAQAEITGTEQLQDGIQQDGHSFRVKMGYSFLRWGRSSRTAFKNGI